MNIPKSPEFKERSEGHADIWECSLQEFINKASPVLDEHWHKNKLDIKVVKLAAQLLRMEYDSKELKGTIDYEVTSAIDNALVYLVNVCGEDV